MSMFVGVWGLMRASMIKLDCLQSPSGVHAHTCGCVSGHWWTLGNLPIGANRVRHTATEMKNKGNVVLQCFPYVDNLTHSYTLFLVFFFLVSFSLSHSLTNTHTRELGSCKVGRIATWYSIRILQQGRLWSRRKYTMQAEDGTRAEDKSKSKAIRTKCVW